jgi:hypothetical protein
MKIHTDNHWLRSNYKNGTVYPLFDFIRELYYSKLIKYYAFDVVHDMAVISGKRETLNYIFLKPSDCGTWHFCNEPSKLDLQGRFDFKAESPLLFRVTVHPDDRDGSKVSDFNIRATIQLMAWNIETQAFQDVREIEPTTWVPLFTENETKEGN